MLISIEKSMVYLAHPKTASKATRQLLEGLGFVRQGGHHAPLVEHPGPSWVVFTAVRNHWDAWVSWYCCHNPAELPFGVKYIESLVDRYPYFYPEPERLWALHDTLADRILRFETIENDLASLLRQPVVLPQVNFGAARKATKKRHYSEFYDEATREFVGRRWKHEIERYGYSYSHGGTNV